MIIRQKHLLLPVLEAWRLAGANQILCDEKQVKEAIVQLNHVIGIQWCRQRCGLGASRERV
ncbi:hypothetical protein ZEAMMB73_Zm00001d036609 [Zea mays]|uniref:Uncharacterized protein n=1 Tax=Zea mays TaxID=4577 RepID=A0A1D6LPS8_MAIZE|nr:hypothetical protein ZEAMMB73_Zm00001d036609 [Zea mays]